MGLISCKCKEKARESCHLGEAREQLELKNEKSIYGLVISHNSHDAGSLNYQNESNDVKGRRGEKKNLKLL